jgi:uncharacterized protein (TIGR02271 family)
MENRSALFPTEVHTMAARKTAAAPVIGPATDDYWREHHADREYILTDLDFDADYLPAYRYGVAVSDRHAARQFDDISADAAKGWKRAAGGSQLTWEQAMPAVRDAFDRVIQLREEQLHVDKETVKAGEVKVKKQVKTEHKRVQVPVEREEVVIERRAVNRPATAAEMGEETVRVPVSEERLKVSKDTVVTEEVSVGKKNVRETETVEDDLKREELVVESDGKAKVRQTARKSKK